MKKNTPKNNDLERIWHTNDMSSIDWNYYAQFYPEKVKAIRALRLDTNLSLRDANCVMDEFFSRIERGEGELNAPFGSQFQRDDLFLRTSSADGKDKIEKAKKAAATAGKAAGVAAAGAAYVGLGTIFNLTGKYMKKSGKKHK